MSEKIGSNPTASICKELAELVGPVRSISFELITELMLLNLGSSRDDGKELDLMFGIYANALAALDSGMRSKFRDAGTEIPAILAESSKDTLRIVREAEKSLLELRKLADENSATTEAFVALSGEMRLIVLPAISDFLAVLQETREENLGGDAQSGEEVVRSAVSKIDTIALSIRLISLNASVEAAHAGEAGRGFAVIAQEIQNLSDEAKQAIDYIRARIA